MEITPDLESALLQWVNSFKLARPVRSWQDFRDGTVFWTMLAQIEPNYFDGQLPDVSTTALDNWVLRWQNLKFVSRKALAYIRDECDKLHNLSGRISPDMKAIATDSSKEDSAKLLQVILLAAMYSPESNERMIATMESLGPSVAIPIAQCIESLEALDVKLGERLGQDAKDSLTNEELTNESRRVSRAVQRDPELEREEEALRNQAKIKDLEGSNTALVEELEQTRLELEGLRQEVAKIRLQHGVETAETKDITLQQLRNTSKADKEHIADLEAEVSVLRTTSEEQERQLERHRAELQSKQSLRDELQLLRVERDELAQSGKVNENLKKKIQALQASSKMSEAVTQDLERSQKEILALRNECAVLKQSNEEKQRTIENGEQAISDQRTARKRVDHELKTITQKLEAAEDRQGRDLETIQELNDRVRGLESHTHSMVSDSLHQELAKDTRIRELTALRDETRRENERLLERVDSLQHGVEEQKELLRNALLENSSQNEENDDLHAVDEYKVIASQLETLKAHPEKTDIIVRLLLSRIDVRRAEQRSAAGDVVQQNKQYQATISDLENRLQVAEEASVKPLKSPAEEHLQRELSLMQSAWYNLSSRLESDAVTIQRRSEAPKSFLNRQRQLVNNPAFVKPKDEFASFRKPSYLSPPGGP